MSLGSVLQTALTGMLTATTSVHVASNNIANARTAGFKASRPVFATQAFSTIRLGSPPSARSGGANPVQIGLGVKVAGIATDFSQAGENGGASLVSGATELSNADIGQNLIDLFMASNYFRANAGRVPNGRQPPG
jgi:flagellar hook protein FlgE